eukprot:2825107-Pyramimonas_sp.AAC.1
MSRGGHGANTVELLVRHRSSTQPGCLRLGLLLCGVAIRALIGTPCIRAREATALPLACGLGLSFLGAKEVLLEAPQCKA